MTSKMQSCVDHIKTSLDVDSWAMELVEHVFTEYDARFDKVLEIIDEVIGRDVEYAKNENDEALKKCIKRSIDTAFDIRDAVEALKGGDM